MRAEENTGDKPKTRRRILLDLTDLLSLMADGIDVTMKVIAERYRGGTSSREATRIYSAMAQTARGLGFTVENVQASSREPGVISVDDPVGLWDAVQGELNSLPQVKFAPFEKVSPEERTSTSKELVAHFGVRLTTLHNWLKRGLPNTRVSGRGQGGINLRFSIPEAEGWLAWAIKKGYVFHDPREGRVSAEVARPRLREIREKIGASVGKFAELLDVEKTALLSWITEPGHGVTVTKTIPKIVLDTAELLLETTREPYRKWAQVDITKEDLKKALEDAYGVRSVAAKALGVAQATVTDLADRWGLSYAKPKAPLVTSVTRQAIRDAMAQAGNRIYKAAPLLGVSNSSLQRLIHAYGLEGELGYRKYRRGGP